MRVNFFKCVLFSSLEASRTSFLPIDTNDFMNSNSGAKRGALHTHSNSVRLLDCDDAEEFDADCLPLLLLLLQLLLVAESGGGVFRTIDDDFAASSSLCCCCSCL